MRWYLAALTVWIAVCAQPAKAADQVPPDPWQVIHIAREFGEADVGHDALKDPMIAGTMGAAPYRIVFYDCRLGRSCTTVLFSARFALEEDIDARTLRDFKEIAATWNRGKLFGRAWLDDANRMVLDHPVAMGNGIGKAALRATFQAWQRALGEYAEILGIPEG